MGPLLALEDAPEWDDPSWPGGRRSWRPPSSLVAVVPLLTLALSARLALREELALGTAALAISSWALRHPDQQGVHEQQQRAQCPQQGAVPRHEERGHIHQHGQRGRRRLQYREGEEDKGGEGGSHVEEWGVHRR